MTGESAVQPRSAKAGQGIERVLVVAPQPFFEDRGTPIAVAQLAAALATLGAEVDLLVYPVGRDVSLARVRIVRCGNPFSIRAVPVGFSLRKVLLDLVILPRLVSLIRGNDYDVVHVLEEMAMPTIFLCRQRGVPVVYDMQSSIPQQLHNHPLLGLGPAQALLRWIERWNVRHAGAVVCSAGLSGHVRALDSQVPVQEWLFAGQAPDQSVMEPTVRRAELDLDPDARLVVYSGTFEPYQGLDLLIAAMPRVLQAFPKAVLLLVGATAGEEITDSDLARDLLRRGQLKVLPRQPRGDMPGYLALADILVSPRAYGDNVPLKVFDYVLAGKPVVATDIRAHRSLLNDETAVLVSSTPDAMAAGIIKLLADPAHGAALATRALQVAGRDPYGKSFEEAVRALYLNAMSRGRGPMRQRQTGGHES